MTDPERKRRWYLAHRELSIKRAVENKRRRKAAKGNALMNFLYGKKNG